MTILQTTDYTQFKFLEGNRLINESHVEKLKKSLRQENLLHINPILVTRDKRVIDGQHRLTACEELNIPVYYRVIDEEVGLEDIQRLNTTVSKWTLLDIANSFAAKGLKPYQDFLRLHKEIGLSVTCTVGLTGQQWGEPFKSGKMKGFDYAKALAMGDMVKKILECVAVSHRIKCFIQALISLLKNSEIDRQNLFVKVKRYAGDLRGASSTKGYHEQLINIYNKGLKGTRKVNLQLVSGMEAAA